MKKFRSKAHANIALVKYWGKENEDIIIPNTNSISLTLDSLYTETEVSFIESENDVFYLDGELQDYKQHIKISKYIDNFRKISGINNSVLIKSINHVPTAAGLASSASGMSCLAMGLNKLFNLNYNLEDVSKLARLGSGSACRSIYGGFVEWIKGSDHNSSYAKKIDDANFDIAMIILVLNGNKKKISSREAMKNTIKTSPLYNGFVESQQKDIDDIKKAIEDRNIKKIGEIAEHNAMKMHATMLASNPPIMYFEEDSIKAINMVKKLRDEGYIAYYTMDAGSNVKIICRMSDSKKIKQEIQKVFSNIDIIISGVGKDASVEEIK